MVDKGNLRAMAAELPLGTDPASVRQRIEGLERLLEGMIEIPGLGRKVGLDALLGLVPVAGDAIAAALGLYLVWEARNLGMPRWQLWDELNQHTIWTAGQVVANFRKNGMAPPSFLFF